MPKKEFTYAQKLAILRRLSQTPKPSQEVVAEELHCRKKKVSEVLKEFRSMTWDEANALCGGDERILALRPDYVDQKVQKAKSDRVVYVAGKSYSVGRSR
ncbi:hypothetical protein ES703_64124 [subsurface metagenome]